MGTTHWSNMSATDPNQHVIDYLRYYADPSRDLDYAVLIDAPWGSGKTHLVKAFLTSEGVEHLYVSLYGVTSTPQIDDELFRQLHPLLGSKGMRLAGRISKGVLKGTLNIDFGEGEHGSVDVRDFFSGPKSRLIVFDDLERAGMKVTDVLGYINAFVEQDGVKAIIVANASEAAKAEERFGEIREKLVGQALFVHADVGAAFPAFLALIADPGVREILRTERATVLETHRQSGTNNLRILKQSLWDFERIAKHLSAEQRAKTNAVRALLSQVLAMAMEIKAGRLSANDFPDLGEGELAIRRYIARHEGAEATPADAFEERYPVWGGDWIVPPAELGAFLAEGNVNAERLKHFFSVSRLFAAPSTIPAWRRAWFGFTSDDDDYEAAIAEVERDFVERAFVDQPLLYHVFGVRLVAVDVGVLPIDRATVVAEGKAYIDDLASKNALESALTSEIGIGDFGSFDGLGYQQVETEEFKQLAAYYAAAAKQATEASYENVARDILTRATVDPQTAFAALSDGNGDVGRVNRVPILASLSPREFVEFVRGYGADTQAKLFEALGRRYRFASQQEDLRDELEWLRNVRPLLDEVAAESRPMTRWRLKSCIDALFDKLPARPAP
jgi:hypothetical protein